MALEDWLVKDRTIYHIPCTSKIKNMEENVGLCLDTCFAVETEQGKFVFCENCIESPPQPIVDAFLLSGKAGPWLCFSLYLRGQESVRFSAQGYPRYTLHLAGDELSIISLHPQKMVVHDLNTLPNLSK